MQEYKDEVIARLRGKIKTRSEQAFLAAMSTDYSGSNPEDHIEKMAIVFGNQMSTIAEEIMVEAEKHYDAPTRPLSQLGT